MTMSPRVRQFALTAHVTASVGWIGAAFAVLALAVIGMRSPDPQTMRGAYLMMRRNHRPVPTVGATRLTST